MVGVLVGIGMLGVVVVAAVLVCRKHETSGLANSLSMASASPVVASLPSFKMVSNTLV